LYLLIRDFRSPNRLKGLEEYYFTAFESAVEFVQNMDATKLKIDKEEFERAVAENKKRLEEEGGPVFPTEPSLKDDRREDTNERLRDDRNPEGEKEQESVEAVKESYKDIIKRLSYLKESTANFDPKSKKFYNVNPNSLTIGDIHDLVAEFNQMCNMHRELCRKVDEINQIADEKLNKGKQQERKILGIFKFK
jgi:hypothetical protein